jgi:hypothetical protein
MITIPVFSVPFSFEKNVFKATEEEINYIKSLDYFNNGDVKISKDSFILTHSKLFKIKEIILNKTYEYKNNILSINNDIVLTQSWSTINYTNSKHHEHDHPNTFISCVLYLKANKVKFVLKKEKSILQEGFNFNYSINNYNVHNSSIWELEINSGDIIFFPGWIKHYSSENMDKEEKILIGANFFLKGKIGEYDKIDLIYL